MSAMSVTLMKGCDPVEKKKISISSKRQITIPQKFYTQLGFDDEAECIVHGNELIIRPIKEENGGEFAEQILEDLISKGYSGDELLIEFKKTQKKVRPAVESLIQEADRVASDEGRYGTYDDAFKSEE
jgi:bifunctional DNA-binding transcriptional regulator/antitoxin component of YhaV-PrlF toxin-antitoxin module